MSYISDELRKRVQEQSKHRCGYCQSQPQYTGHSLEIDHLKPLRYGGTDEENNLWAACSMCNAYKGTQTHVNDPETEELTALFNPRFQQWDDHFKWSDEGTKIIGLTPTGRATVVALQLNNFIALTGRRNWVAAGWHPPKD